MDRIQGQTDQAACQDANPCRICRFRERSSRELFAFLVFSGDHCDIISMMVMNLHHIGCIFNFDIIYMY